MENDNMNLALKQAKIALQNDEIPVGCVIFYNGKLIGCGYNKKETSKNPTMHAEIVAINDACSKLKSWHLDDCIMYVTLKPCMMCMGAIIESRIKTIYYGTENNSEQMYDYDKITKYVNLINIKNKECSEILSYFFKKKRKI